VFRTVSIQLGGGEEDEVGDEVGGAHRVGGGGAKISQSHMRACDVLRVGLFVFWGFWSVCEGERGVLSPNAEGGVPGASAKSVTIRGDAEAGDAVNVSAERLDALATKSVPNVAVVVVVPGVEVASREGEGDRRDTAEEVRGGVGHELSASAKIEEAAGGVVGTGTECVARGEELDGIDVGAVSGEGLSANSRADVP